MLFKTSRRRVEDLERELASLQAVVDTTAARLKAVEMEWEDWYNKFRSLYGRLNKRDQREKEAAPPPSGPSNGNHAVNPLALRLLQSQEHGE